MEVSASVDEAAPLYFLSPMMSAGYAGGCIYAKVDAQY
jgi:hypothetical protein